MFLQAFENLKAEHSFDDFKILRQTAEKLAAEKIMALELTKEFEVYSEAVTDALRKVRQLQNVAQVLHT